MNKPDPCLSNCRRDGKALERFLQDYFDGNLKRYLKSEPIPESNDGPVKVRCSQPHEGSKHLPVLTSPCALSYIEI